MIYNIKKYIKIIINNLYLYYNITRNYLYLYYIRYYISKAKDPKDLIIILQYITANNKETTTDELLNIITNCFIKYPLTDIELQKISSWQQLYNDELGLYNYVTCFFWLCAIQSIQENEQKYIM